MRPAVANYFSCNISIFGARILCSCPIFFDTNEHHISVNFSLTPKKPSFFFHSYHLILMKYSATTGFHSLHTPPCCFPSLHSSPCFFRAHVSFGVALICIVSVITIYLWDTYHGFLNPLVLGGSSGF